MWSCVLELIIQQTNSTVTTTIVAMTAEQPGQLSQIWSVIWSIVTAVLSACAVITISKLIEWRRKPAFELDLDFTAMRTFVVEAIEGKVVGRGKYFRLKVTNVRPQPAHRCEAKIEPMDAEGNPLFDSSILHWVRREAHVYPKPEDQYAPITINSKDHEFLDVLMVTDVPITQYRADKDRTETVRFAAVQTYSHRPFPVQRTKSGYNYTFKITVFGENADPKSITITFSGWDGTFEGFNAECFSEVDRSTRA